MSDQNFKVKNGLDVGQSGVLEYDSNSSKLRFSNDGGSTFSDLGSGNAETQVFTKTENYILTLEDANNIIEMNVATANTVTVPLDSSVDFPVGTRVNVVQIGAGQTEIVGASGVTVTSKASSTRISKQYGKVTLYKSAANTWTLEGNLARKLATQPSHYFVQASDAGSIVEFNSSSESIVFIREDAQENLPVGSRIDVAQIGSGRVFFLPQSTTSLFWTTQTSNFGTTAVWSAAYGNGTWVVVGSYGQLRTSTDAITWITRTSNIGTLTRSVAFGNNTWVAGGNGGNLRTSTDAITWVTQNSNFGTSVINSIAFANNLWVAVGGLGQIRTSTDAVTWVAQTSNFGGFDVNSVAFADNTWVAAATNGQLRTSTDAIAWVTRTSNFGSTQILSVAFGNNTWAAVGDAGQLRTSSPLTGRSRSYNIGSNGRVFFSTDSTTWATATINLVDGLGSSILAANKFTSAAYNPATFTWALAGDQGLIVRSSQVDDALGTFNTVHNVETVNWTTQNSNFGTTAILSVAFANNLWVAGGVSGQLRTSTDAVTWVTQTSNFGTEEIRAVAFGNNLWVAGGLSGQIRTSTDAVTWVTQTSNFGTTAIQAVAFGNNTWVAGGLQGQIRTSTDAITWVTQTSNFGNQRVWSVVFGNNIWVAGGYGGVIRTSTDAATWVTQTSNFGTTNIRSVAFGNNTWIAAGFTGQLRTSTDAVTWVTQTSNFGTTNIFSVAFANNTWVAGGDSGQLRTSTDAITWVTQTSNFGTTRIESLAFGSSLWVAVGYVGQIRTSATAPTVPGLRHFSADASKFVAISSSGIFTSPTALLASFTSEFSNANLRRHVFLNNRSFALGDSGLIVENTSGTSWTTISTGITENLVNMAFRDGTYWLEGATNAFTSTDLTTWTTASVTGVTVPQITDVVGTPAGFLAGSSTGAVLLSTNGTSFSQVASFGSSAVRDVNYDASAAFPYTAAAVGGGFLRSTDAATWTSISAGTFSNQDLEVATFGGVTVVPAGVVWATQTSNFAATIRSVAFGSSLWVAGGESGQLRTSTNAVTWVTRELNFGTSIVRSVAFGGGQWLAGGDSVQLRMSMGLSSSPVVLLSKDGNTKILSQNGVASLYKRSANTWALIGDLGI